MSFKFNGARINRERVVQRRVKDTQAFIDPPSHLDSSESLIKFSGRFTTLFKPCEAFIGATFVFRKKRHHLIVGKSELGQRCEARLNIVAPWMRFAHDRSIHPRVTGAFNMSG